MGGGKAIRRRQKSMTKANEGNLHKSQRGKAGATAFIPLPGPPTQHDYKEKMPASLRKMLALKEASQQPSKRAKLQPARPPQQQQPQQQQQQQQQPQPQEQQQQEDGQSAGISYKGEPPNTLQLEVKQQQQQQQQQPVSKGALIWEQPKKLKARKKEYLSAKKLKKKKKKNKRADGADDDADDDFTAAASSTTAPKPRAAQPAFGEVIHAPPQVHLKRKHWDPAAADNAAQQQQQQQANKHKPKKKLVTLQASSELAELRQQAIAGYRIGRTPTEGRATLQSLKALVQH